MSSACFACFACFANFACFKSGLAGAYPEHPQRTRKRRGRALGADRYLLRFGAVKTQPPGSQLPTQNTARTPKRRTGAETGALRVSEWTLDVAFCHLLTGTATGVSTSPTHQN